MRPLTEAKLDISTDIHFYKLIVCKNNSRYIGSWAVPQGTAWLTGSCCLCLIFRTQFVELMEKCSSSNSSLPGQISPSQQLSTGATLVTPPYVSPCTSPLLSRDCKQSSLCQLFSLFECFSCKFSRIFLIILFSEVDRHSFVFVFLQIGKPSAPQSERGS